jgi:hypothetical protein
MLVKVNALKIIVNMLFLLLCFGTCFADLGFIDSVGLYNKGGQIEPHGLNLYQTHSSPDSPIGIGKTEFEVYEDISSLFWFPKGFSFSSKKAISIGLFLGDGYKNSPENIYFGINTNEGTFVFSQKNGIPINMAQVSTDIPKDIKAIYGAKKYPAICSYDRKKEFLSCRTEKLESYIQGKIGGTLDLNSVFIIVSGFKGKAINIDSFKIQDLENSAFKSKQNTVVLKGAVKGDVLNDAYVYMLDEKNNVKKTQVGLDGSFVFTDMIEGERVSVWYRHEAFDYYASVGRWLEVKSNIDLEIHLDLEYVNYKGANSKPDSYKFVVETTPDKQDSLYKPHARMAWHGSSIQVYENYPVPNNIGYIDRDRRIENPMNCLRIVHTGASGSVGLQVKTSEKFNILLEERLGVSLGRCVEVFSIGRDNGDIGTHYKRVKHFITKYKPDLFMFEEGSGLMFQIQPQLLKLFLGYDFDHNIFPHFYYDKDGSLKFNEEDGTYGMYASKVDHSPLVDDVPLASSFSVPVENMHEYAHDSWKYFKDIYKVYTELFPEQKFAFQTGMDIARCQYPCTESKSSSGYSYGPKEYIRNFKNFADKEGILSFHPDITDEYNHLTTQLTFLYDSHYSTRGHQWLAKELTSKLAQYYRFKNK